MPGARQDIRFVAGAAVVALLVVELGLRLAGLDPGEVNPHFEEGSDTRWSQPDALLGWRNRAGTWKSVECGKVPMTFRDDGTRRAPAEPKAATGPDEGVLFFGASYVQGYGVPDTDTFFQRLNEQLPGVGFRSYGTGGYNTLQAAMLAREVLDAAPAGVRPQLVVYAFSDGDTRRNVAQHSVVLNLRGPGGRFVVPPHVRIQGGDAERRESSVIEPWPGARYLAIVMLLQRVAITARYATGDDEPVQATRLLVDEFAAAMAERGVEFAVMVLKSEPPLHDAIFADSPYPVIDCRFEDGPELSVCGDGHGHPNARVHALWAGCLAAWLRDHPAARERS